MTPSNYGHKILKNTCSTQVKKQESQVTLKQPYQLEICGFSNEKRQAGQLLFLSPAVLYHSLNRRGRKDENHSGIDRKTA
jgi:hypothetical protein